MPPLPAEAGKCRGCDDQRCKATFTCRTCSAVKNTCMNRVGGFSKHGPGECNHCFELRVFGPQWIAAWHAEGKGRRKRAVVEKIVAEALEYQGGKR